jgi:hypothetical protein
VGTLKSLSSFVSKYPHTEYDYGTAYNAALGSVLENVFSSWNRGTRVTQFPMYPQGDSLTGFTYGTAIFSNGLNKQKYTWQHYYYQENGSGRTLATGSNGDASNVPVYIRKRISPWKRVGRIGDYNSLISKYPMNRHDYAVTYNAGMGDIHNVVINSWNKGVRLTCFPHYAQNDNVNGLEFGTAVFVSGTNGQRYTWEQYYYQENGNSKTTRIGGNGNAASVSLYVSAILDTVSTC